MKKYFLLATFCFVFPLILNAQYSFLLDDDKQINTQEKIEVENTSSNIVSVVNSPVELLAPRPHYKNYRGSTYHLAMQGGVSQGGLRMNKAELIDVIAKPSVLGQLSVFKHMAGISFQTGLGITQHRFEVETVSAEGRKLHLLFLDIPLLARYHFSPAFYASGGLVPAINLNTKSDFDLGTGRAEGDNGMKTRHDTAKNAISNVRVCAGYFFPSGLSIQGTYTKAMGEILKDGSDGKTFGYIDLQIGYVIFKGKSK